MSASVDQRTFGEVLLDLPQAEGYEERKTEAQRQMAANILDGIGQSLKINGFFVGFFAAIVPQNVIDLLSAALVKKGWEVSSRTTPNGDTAITIEPAKPVKAIEAAPESKL